MKKIVFHVSTPKASKAQRPWVYETIDEYVRNIRDMISVVDVLEGVHLCVSVRPSDGLDLVDLLDLVDKSNNVTFLSDFNRSDMFHCADLLVSYSSTAIEEAIAYGLHVMQYDPDGKYSHIDDNECGLISTCHDKSLLAQHIRSLLFEKGLGGRGEEKWKQSHEVMNLDQTDFSWLISLIEASDN